jgi:hypothetical protein
MRIGPEDGLSGIRLLLLEEAGSMTQEVDGEGPISMWEAPMVPA